MTIVAIEADADRTLEIVHELRQTLEQHVDFDYRFTQGGYNWVTHETWKPLAEFTFYNPTDATAFTLKYL